MTKTLNFKVKGQNIYLENPEDRLVAGSIGYLKAHFTFDNDWQYVDFKGITHPLTIKILYSCRGKTYEENFNSYFLGENLIPAKALISPGFSVCCYGEYVDEDGIVRKRLPTETIDILLKPSGPISGNLIADSQTKADAFALAERAMEEIQLIKEHLNI